MRALSFGPDPAPAPILVHLVLDSAEGLSQLKTGEKPRVFVVQQSDLMKLRTLGSNVLDLKTKLPAKQLARYFLGVADEKTPILKGDYLSTAQLRRSVKAFLNKALKQAERNVYFLSVDAALFATLAEDAERRREMPGFPSPSRTRNSPDMPSDGRGTASLASLIALFPDELTPPQLREKYVGDSPDIEMVRKLIVRASKNLEPVLIQGETGTGKEIVARAIHDLTRETDKNRSDVFQALNCGAIPNDLVASELFGHTAGAFTGARAERLGLFRSAEKGTVFLDEIGDLSWNHQTSLLRVLEEKKVRPVGSDTDVVVDVRIIAATNLDLFSMVQRKQFRADLYYRLRVFWIPTPPLREHVDDIPILAQHMWRSIQDRTNAEPLPQEILNALKEYPWFGNARLLRAALATLHSWYGARDLGLQHLTAVMQFFRQESSTAREPAAMDPIDLHRIECLRHLRTAEEVIRAAKVALRSLDTTKQTSIKIRHAMASTLADRIRELDTLCLKPSLFYSGSTFDAVYQLKGHLMRLHGLLPQRIDDARAYYAENLKRHFGQSVPAICKGIELVLADYDRNTHAAPYHWVLAEDKG